jgi:hypothetical protein
VKVKRLKVRDESDVVKMKIDDLMDGASDISMAGGVRRKDADSRSLQTIFAITGTSFRDVSGVKHSSYYEVGSYCPYYCIIAYPACIKRSEICSLVVNLTQRVGKVVEVEKSLSWNRLKVHFPERNGRCSYVFKKVLECFGCKHVDESDPVDFDD